MTGRQREALGKALCSAFDQDSLDQMLRHRLNKDREQLVGSGSLRTVVFRLIEVAAREGWQADLVGAARAANPTNPILQRFSEENSVLNTPEEGSAVTENPHESPNGSDEKGVGLTPWAVFQAALQAVPALKYALAVLGVVSAIAVVKGFGIDFRVAVFGAVIMLVLMAALVVFAALTRVSSPQLRAAALVLMWSSVALTILSALLLFTSTFFDYPVDLAQVFGSPPERLTEPGPDPQREGVLLSANRFLQGKHPDFPRMQDVIHDDVPQIRARSSDNGQFFCSDPITARRTDPTVVVKGIPTAPASPMIRVYVFAPRWDEGPTLKETTGEVHDGTATLKLKGQAAAGSVVFVVYWVEGATGTIPAANRLEVWLQ